VTGIRAAFVLLIALHQPSLARDYDSASHA
jgi:hypothetical protein